MQRQIIDGVAGYVELPDDGSIVMAEDMIIVKF